jgi:hypothetical protein
MQISIIGKPDSIDANYCREAVRYFGRQLLSKHLNKNIKLKVVFDEIKYKGTCTWNDSPRFGRDFTIQIDARLGWRLTLISLAHEMVHVKQYASGELQDYRTDVNKCKWRGDIYYCYTDEDYWLYSPWEIDAFGRELGLYKTFMETYNELA